MTREPIDARQAQTCSSAGQRILSAGLLTVLAAIASSVLLLQFRYEPCETAQWSASITGQSPAIKAGAGPPPDDPQRIQAQPRSRDLTAGLTPLKSAEHFDRQTLSEKRDCRSLKPIHVEGS